jgi:hypothetical protein
MLNVCMSAALGGPVAVGAVACMTNEDVIDDRTSCYMRGHLWSIAVQLIIVRPK